MQPLYPILDVEMAASRGHDLIACARGFTGLGCALQQLRAKRLPDREFLELADRLVAVVPQLIVNDRADIALLSGAAGVHVGQDDLPADVVRSLQLTGAGPRSAAPSVGEWTIGASTHSLDQASAALALGPDYLAIGPVYPTQTKEHPDPVVGCALVRALRPLSPKPLVAIGGIQLSNCVEVWRAGADAVAVISGLWAAADPVEAARQFLLAFQRV